MFPGETVLSGGKHPNTPLEVLESGAGFYLGFKTPTGEPYSRETVYMTEVVAHSLLKMIRGHE